MGSPFMRLKALRASSFIIKSTSLDRRLVKGLENFYKVFDKSILEVCVAEESSMAL